MTTAVATYCPGMCRVDPVLDQVAGLGLDDGLVHGDGPSDVALAWRGLSRPGHDVDELLHVDSTLGTSVSSSRLAAWDS